MSNQNTKLSKSDLNDVSGGFFAYDPTFLGGVVAPKQNVEGNQFISGGDGNDILIKQPPNSLTGGEGSDVLRF